MAEFSLLIQNWILASEGGFSDHPADPGGATNFGITQQTLAGWRGRPANRHDVKALSKTEALSILKAQYWDAIRGDELPAGLDYALFDYAVNSGPARAVKDLQRILEIEADGILGGATLAAIRKYANVVGLIEALCSRRWAFVQRLSTFKTFGEGWKRRIWGTSLGVQSGDTGVADRAIGLATQREPLSVDQLRPAPGRARPERPSITAALTQDPGGLSGIGAAGAAVASAIADQPILQVAAVAMIVVLVWRFVLSRREADPA